MAKRGRPIKEDARRREYRLRMTDNEYEQLEQMSEQSGITMADVIRESLSLYKLANRCDELDNRNR